MAVALDFATEAPDYPYTSVTSYSWSHNPTGTPRAVVVFVYTAGTNGSTKTVTGVTYDGVAMTDMTGLAVADTATEQGRIDTFFLGASVPTTDPATVVVSRTSNTTAMGGVVVTLTAGDDTEIYEAGAVLLQENAAISSQAVDDGSTGVDSLRLAAAYYGGPNPAPVDSANTSLIISEDWGAYGFTCGRETTAGQGSRSVGFTASADDRAVIHFAVREIVVVPKPRLALLRGVGGPP